MRSPRGSGFGGPEGFGLPGLGFADAGFAVVDFADAGLTILGSGAFGFANAAGFGFEVRLGPVVGRAPRS